MADSPKHTTILLAFALLAASAPAAGMQAPQAAAQPASSHVLSVRDYGATGDGTTLDTAAIEKAIKACADAGGGTVYFPPGQYVTGTFELASHVTLKLEAGAVILGSTNLADYGSISDYGLGRDYGVNSSGEGYRVGLIVARNVTDVSIVGRGAIDGRGDEFMDMNVPHISPDFDAKYTRQGEAFMRAMRSTEFGPVEARNAGEGRPGTMIIIFKCRNVLIRDVTLRNAPNWGLHLQGTEDAVITGIHIKNSLLIPNDDGIDCIGCRNVHISDCDISAGDDDFAIVGSENVNVTNCSLVSRSSAIRLEDTRYSTFQNLTIRSNRGLAIYQRGSEVTEDVLFSDIAIETHLITGHWWGKAEPIYIAVSGSKPGEAGGRVRDVRFSNIIGEAESGMLIYGSPDSPVENLTLDRVRLRIKAPPKRISDAVGGNFDLRWTATNLAEAIFKHDIPGLYARYMNNLTIRDLEIAWGDGSPSYFSGGVFCENFRNLTIDGFDGRQAPEEGNAAAVTLRHGHDFTIRNSRAADGTRTFLSLSGVKGKFLLMSNDLSSAAQLVSPEGTPLRLYGNYLPASKTQTEQPHIPKQSPR